METIRELIEALNPFEAYDWGEEMADVAGLVVARPGEHPQVILNSGYTGDLKAALVAVLEDYLGGDLSERRGWLAGGEARRLKPVETLVFERILNAA